MPTLRSLIGAAALTILGTPPAGAAMVTYYHAGAWHAFSGRDKAGHMVCGMAASDPTNAGQVTITAVIGTDRLHFRVSKPTWAIPLGTSVALFMRIGHGDAVAYEATGEATHLDWSLNAGQTGPFQSLFRTAGAMTLRFPDGNEPPWRVSLAGSEAVDRTFAVCVRDLSAQAAQAARAAAAKPSQPFGQEPTQPMIVSHPLAPPPGTGPGPIAPDAATPAPAARSP